MYNKKIAQGNKHVTEKSLPPYPLNLIQGFGNSGIFNKPRSIPPSLVW